MEDPYQSIHISNGLLQINFQLFYSAGSFTITTTAYKFRFQNNEFALIGADNYIFNRGTHDIEDYSFNFSTGKYSITRGNDNATQKLNTEWHTLNLKELKTLKTFKKPYNWDIGVVYL